ncbi:hypothetical protein [Marinicellulosiphila megalodicopiae]|uniref:hypothetical protein n=1 Tax=Marinicellulosiphila megalodicopiae TaxID=2724896 RepID=UPI003BB15B9B
MAELLKDQYNQDFVQLLCQKIATLSPLANKQKDILTLFMQDDWEQLELKQRMNRAGFVCLSLIPQSDFAKACTIIKQLSKEFDAFLGMFIPQMITDLFFSYDLIKQQSCLDIAFDALICVTQNSTSEFAIRAFIVQFPTQTMSFLLSCCNHKSEHVRRLASEGCRPRLPWAQALTELKHNPDPIWPILNRLCEDDSLYVRRSVANNLNDISKDHPDLMLNWCESNNHKTQDIDWIIKHACRVLLKQANIRALQLFDYSNPKHIAVIDFSIDQTTLSIGEKLTFNATIKSKKPLGKIRVEYCIDYLKANNKHNQKVFNWSEKTIECKTIQLKASQSFAQMSTRTHHAGTHFISIRVNGVMHQRVEFELTDSF